MSFALGNLSLVSNLFLAPLAGYTNLPFRIIIRDLGPVGLCTTDLVNARSLIDRNRKALELIRTTDRDRPLAVQLYGTRADEMSEAARILEGRGVQAIDVNMGCPVRKVCRNGGGSALMTNPAAAARMVEAMIAAVRIPVTCKMRLGWDDANLTAPRLARALEDVGVAAIIVHGRTRAQGFTGHVNHDGIRAVVEAVRSVPVVGNGDITTPQAARRMFERTGCAAISIGRGAFYNPWIFRHTAAYLASGERAAEPTLAERLAVMRRHLDLMIEEFGEERGCQKFRKVAVQYSSRFGPRKEFDKQIVRLRTRAEFETVIGEYLAWRERFLGADGQLREPYRPVPLDDASPAPGRAVPVPAGPIDHW